MNFTSDKKKLLSLGLVLLILLIGVGAIVASNYKAFFNTTSTSQSALDTEILRLEKEIAMRPTRSTPYIGLSALYLQKIRETSDSSYYQKIDDLLIQAEKINPQDADIYAMRATVSNGRHDFKKGKEFIDKALALNTTTALYYGIAGDCAIELGDYEQAVSYFQKMVDTRPSFASWSRIAYIRELYGDFGGAQVALEQAIASGSKYPENIAWAYVEKGKLDIRTNPQEARTNFEMALKVLPTYSQAMEGLGRVAYVTGDTREAEAQFMNAYKQLALAQYAIDLGDLYQVTGETQKASQYYALAQEAYATSAKAGVDTDLEESLFLSERGLRLADALAMAQRASIARPNRNAADALALAQLKNNQIAQAVTNRQKAFTLGQNDPAILYHQSLVARANKEEKLADEFLAKSKKINPHFSILFDEKTPAAKP